MRLTLVGVSVTTTSPLTSWSLLVSNMYPWVVGRSTFACDNRCRNVFTQLCTVAICHWQPSRSSPLLRPLIPMYCHAMPITWDQYPATLTITSWAIQPLICRTGLGRFAPRLTTSKASLGYPLTCLWVRHRVDSFLIGIRHVSQDPFLDTNLVFSTRRPFRYRAPLLPYSILTAR